MKNVLTLFLLFPVVVVNAQAKLIPTPNVIEQKWLKNGQYQTTWYFVKDTTKVEIGEITTTTITTQDKVTVVNQVKLKQMKTAWVDSTIADRQTLKPVYHASYNGQRDMVLSFGSIITGYYKDKQKQTVIAIRDTTNNGYFDSSLYPMLVSWLPLKEGYTKEIAIYDYNPKGKIGILTASIENVQKGIYNSLKLGDRAVWVVRVSDDILGNTNSSVTYYIDVIDRKIWKREMEAGGRKMLEITKE